MNGKNRLIDFRIVYQRAGYAGAVALRKIIDQIKPASAQQVRWPH
jgi:hypothetical protein